MTGTIEQGRRGALTARKSECRGAAAALLGLAAAALAGCAAVPQPVASQVVIEEPEPVAIPPGRYPASPQMLDFQDYGHTIADQVSRDRYFGGFVFKWDPEPHAIVMFTRDPEERLRRYTSDPRFRAQKVDFTLAELEAMKEATTRQLMGLRLECWTSDADEERNVVTVSAPRPELEKLRAAIADGRFTPPPKFRLVTGSCVTWR